LVGEVILQLTSLDFNYKGQLANVKRLIEFKDGYSLKSE